MSGFKLLAIQPLEGIEYYTRKNLIPGTVYKFYEGYDFMPKQGKVVEIKEPEESLPELYDIKTESKNISVNVSAIVGANGSGKSSLLELFYNFCFCMSQNEPGIGETIERYREDLPFLREDILRSVNNLKVEVFYSVGNVIRSIRYESGHYEQFTFDPKRSAGESVRIQDFCYSIAANYSLYGLNESENPWLRLLFHKNDGYQSPLVINPMRTEGIIDVNREFDLSQARILLNLADSKNIQLEIVKGKYISEIEFSFKPIKLKRVGYYKAEYLLDDIINTHLSVHGTSVYQLFNELVELLFPDQDKPLISNKELSKYSTLDEKGIESIIDDELKKISDNPSPVQYDLIKYFMIKYTIKKVFKTCLNYSSLREKFIDFRDVYSKESPIIHKGKIGKLLSALVTDKSHLTFKLKQAIYTLQNETFKTRTLNWGRGYRRDPDDMSDPNTAYEPEYSERFEFFKFWLRLNLSDYQKIMLKGTSTVEHFTDVHKVPGAFIVPEFKYRLKDGLDSSARKMSSGEQQFFQSVNTIVYHLRNLDSVHDSSIRPNKSYNNVNIVLDEIELYYHPEYQRNYLSNLLTNIQNIGLRNIDHINIVFSTHSPFILSDISSTSILHLKDGAPYFHEIQEETFGANIHELLANDFFLENGFMGEFAKRKINDTIKFLSYYVNRRRLTEEFNEVVDNEATDDEYYKFQRSALQSENSFLENQIRNWDKDFHRIIINLIGERTLRTKLEEMYNHAFKPNN